MSEKQVKANRQNAQRSTGPVSDQGKQTVRYNALQHGLCATAVVLPDESESVYNVLKAELVDELQPETVLEACLCELVLSKLWRLARAQRIEAEHLRENWTQLMGPDGLAAAFRRSRVDTVQRYETGLERALYKALSAYWDTQRQRLDRQAISG